VCGNGERGQLGIGIATIKEYKPLKVKLIDEKGKPYLMTPKFKQVSCGHNYTGFLTESGVIYIAGDNQNFQLGMELPMHTEDTLDEQRDMTNSPLALDIQADKPIQIRKLMFGLYSCALTFSGEVYAWGLPPYKVPILLRA
jgi:alpha-tubulin suppressor-like RCC1 family protein